MHFCTLYDEIHLNVITIYDTMMMSLQVPMDPMRALASLDLMSARGLETPDQVEMGEFGLVKLFHI